MTRPSRRSLAAAVLLLVLALTSACAAGTPSAPTTEVFASAPWGASERMEYHLSNAEGVVLGTGFLTTERDGDALVLRQAYEEAGAPAGATPTSDTVSVRVDAATLRPLSGEREITRRAPDGALTDERYQWTYSGGASGAAPRLSTTHVRGDASDVRDFNVRDHYYDNESSLWLWRTIAFAEGYDEGYVSVNPIENSQQTVNLRIPQQETVEVPAGTFQAWRLLFRNGRAVRTAWVNVEAPHQVLRWDNGDTIFELVSYEVE